MTKTYDVLYQNRGDEHISRVALVTKSLPKARAYCRELKGPLTTAIHYAITCDDGSTIIDTSRDGI